MSLPRLVREKLLRVAAPAIEARIAFMHIPKCGGTSIDHAMRAAFGWPLVRYRVAQRINARSSLRGAEAAGMELEQYRELLLLYFLAQPNLRYVSGHFPFSERALREFGGEWRFVTILRHPVSRWFSHFFFNRYKVGDHFRIQADLATFVASEQGRRFGSFLVRKLTAERLADVPMDEQVGLAIQNLQRFAVVGLLEHLPVFARRFEAEFGWRLKIRQLNENPRTRDQRNHEITPEMRTLVEQLCAPDLNVYNHVLGRIQDHV